MLLSLGFILLLFFLLFLWYDLSEATAWLANTLDFNKCLSTFLVYIYILHILFQLKMLY